MLQGVNSNHHFSVSKGMHNHFEIDDLYQLVRYARFDDRAFKNQQLDEQKLLTDLSALKVQENIATKDAIEILTTDHQYLTDLFLAYENLANASQDNSVEKAQLIAEICTELALHTQIEEKIFYPAAKAALLNTDYLVDEPIIEYAGLMALIADVEHDQLLGKCCENKIKVLSEYLQHHVKQERDLFPQVRTANIDLQALGQEMALEKLALTAQHRALMSDKDCKFKGLS